MKFQIYCFFIILFSLQSFAQEDHTDYIEGPFESPQEITQTCLDCHDGIQEGIMKSRHWNWRGNISESGEESFGKQNMINNFCIATSSNWPRCTSCHIGYGWEDKDFDFEDANNIDCLVCHDQTGTYKKSPAGGGYPEDDVDLIKITQSVGPTKRMNCGACHFNGGGGTGVKHGDLDESLIDPSPELDFHMGGLEFECSECHAGENHQIIGASHGSLSDNSNHLLCSGCHSDEPHSKEILNLHGNSIACETCHIPNFAKEIPTKIWWDWSKAGQDLPAKNDEFGMILYDKKKGEFEWGKNLIPDYRWHNGKAEYYSIGSEINSKEIVRLNSLSGRKDDPESKIAPFKVMRGTQIFDSANNYLIVPKLYGKGGYWATFNWDSAAILGMKSVGLDYSGKHDFIETEMLWPINHMVANAEEALKCTSCHGNKGKKRLNWKELGYKTDPLKSGSRFNK